MSFRMGMLLKANHISCDDKEMAFQSHTASSCLCFSVCNCMCVHMILVKRKRQTHIMAFIPIDVPKWDSWSIYSTSSLICLFEPAVEKEPYVNKRRGKKTHVILFPFGSLALYLWHESVVHIRTGTYTQLVSFVLRSMDGLIACVRQRVRIFFANLVNETSMVQNESVIESDDFFAVSIRQAKCLVVYRVLGVQR